MQKDMLNALHARYTRQEISWSQFLKESVKQIQAIVDSYVSLTREARLEVATDFFPRFVRICQEYHPCAEGLDAYVGASLRYFCRSWCRHNAREWTKEDVVVHDCQHQWEVREDEPDLEHAPPLLDRLVLSNTRQRDTVRKQLIICLCKNLPLLDESEKQRYAHLLQLPYRWIDELDRCIGPRPDQDLARKREYQRLRNRHYAAMMRSEIIRHEDRSYNEHHEVENPQQVEQFHRKRWEFYAERLRRHKQYLSNREVALLLGIPKGSVDSALANLSRRLARLAERALPSRHGHDHSFIQQWAQATRN